MLSLEYLTGYGTPDEEPPAYDDDQSSLSETVQDEYDYDYHKKILDDQTTVFFNPLLVTTPALAVRGSKKIEVRVIQNLGEGGCVGFALACLGVLGKTVELVKEKLNAQIDEVWAKLRETNPDATRDDAGINNEQWHSTVIVAALKANSDDFQFRKVWHCASQEKLVLEPNKSYIIDGTLAPKYHHPVTDKIIYQSDYISYNQDPSKWRHCIAVLYDTKKKAHFVGCRMLEKKWQPVDVLRLDEMKNEEKRGYMRRIFRVYEVQTKTMNTEMRKVVEKKAKRSKPFGKRSTSSKNKKQKSSFDSKKSSQMKCTQECEKKISFDTKKQMKVLNPRKPRLVNGRYYGAKTKIVKKMCKFILEYCENKKYHKIIDCFCGSGSVSIEFHKQTDVPVFASDHFRCLIVTLLALQNGWVPPSSVTKKEFKDLKTQEDNPVKSLVHVFSSTFGCLFKNRQKQRANITFLVQNVRRR